MTPGTPLSAEKRQRLFTLLLTELRAAAKRGAATPPGTPACAVAELHDRPTAEEGEGERGPRPDIVATEEPG